MSAIESITKLCSCCRHERPVGRFLYSQFTVDGLTDRCLDCISAEAKANRQQREMRRAPSAPTAKRKRTVKRNRVSRQVIAASYA